MLHGYSIDKENTVCALENLAFVQKQKGISVSMLFDCMRLIRVMIMLLWPLEMLITMAGYVFAIYRNYAFGP